MTTVLIQAVPLRKVKAGDIVVYDGKQYKTWQHFKVVSAAATMVTASPRVHDGWSVKAVALYYAGDRPIAELVVDPS